MKRPAVKAYQKQIKNPALRNAIMEQYITQGQFAKAARVDEAIISRIVRGKRKATLNQKEKFAELLNKPMEELFND